MKYIKRMKGSHPRRVSIEAKFIGLSVGLILLTAVGLSSFIVYAIIPDQREDLLYYGRSIATILAENAEFGVYTKDRAALELLLKSAKADANIAHVAILDATNTVIIEMASESQQFSGQATGETKGHTPESKQIVPPGEGITQIEHQNHVDIFAPIRTQPFDFTDSAYSSTGTVIGYIRLGLREDRPNQSIRKIIYSAFFTVLCFLAVGIALTVFFSRRIAAPIKKLANAVSEVSEFDFDHHVKIRSNDEIAELSEQFNKLVDRLANYRDQTTAFQRDLEEKKQVAEAANRAKSEFLANMSHELRTPLNHIIGFTELVVDEHCGELNEDQKDYLNDVLQSSRHLLSLINDILDLSKIEAGKLELECSEVDIKDLLERSLIMFREKAMKHRIAMSNHVNGIPATIFADERKIKQVIYNLLSNAVKFTPDGGQISLSASMMDTSPAAEATDISTDRQPHLVISVRDNGIGISERDLVRIFDPFEQVESDYGRKYQGTGLGLSLTRRLVELHGGDIWAESEGLGRGSTFSFKIGIKPI